MMAGQWIHGGFTLPAGPAVVPLDPRAASKAELFRYYFMTLRDRTVHASYVGRDAAGNTSWFHRPWSSFYSLACGKQDIGRRFVPCSWEPIDYSFAPDFSPCGCIVGYVRSTYEAPCKFHAGGIDKGIRYYVAADVAALMPFPTIFHPSTQIQPYSRGAAPGERTPYREEWWNLGYSAGNAPGVAPTGTPAQFLGLTSASYNETLPTPVNLVPGCDMPIGPLTVEDVDPNTVVVSNVTKITLDTGGFEVTQIAPGWAKLKAKASLKVTLTGGTPTYSNLTEVILHKRDFELTQSVVGKAEVKLLEAWPTPMAISTNVVDLAIDDDAKIVALNVSSNATITGIAGGRPGRQLKIVNTGIATLMFFNGGAGSLPQNAFNMSTTRVYLPPKGTLNLVYNGATLLWHVDQKFVAGPTPALTTARPLVSFGEGSEVNGWLLTPAAIEEIGELLYGNKPFSFPTGPALVTGNELDPSANRVVTFTGAPNQMINNITRAFPGRTLTIVNQTSGDLLLKHNDTGIFPAGNIWGPGEVDYTLAQYDTVDLTNALHTGVNAWFIIDRENAELGAAALAEVMALI